MHANSICDSPGKKAALSCRGGSNGVVFWALRQNWDEPPLDGNASMGKILPPIAAQFLSVLILAFFWVGTALADKRVALVIGNSQYSHVTPKLASPANDAHDISQALVSVGFDVILETDIGKAKFDRSLAEFARKASGADTALFYYAGLGLQYQ